MSVEVLVGGSVDTCECVGKVEVLGKTYLVVILTITTIRQVVIEG